MPHAVQEIEPAAALERQIEQHQARPPHLDRAQALPRARRADGAKAVGDEVLDQERAGGLVVLHNQDQLLLVHSAP